MPERETIAFYLRLMFLPALLLLTMLRAWSSSWSALEAIQRRQEPRFQRMWDLLPPDVQQAAEASEAEGLPDPAIRRFAIMLGDYVSLRTMLAEAREQGSKYQYRNALDAANRRLRIAKAREAAALRALADSREG